MSTSAANYMNFRMRRKKDRFPVRLAVIWFVLDQVKFSRFAKFSLVHEGSNVHGCSECQVTSRLTMSKKNVRTTQMRFCPLPCQQRLLWRGCVASLDFVCWRYEMNENWPLDNPCQKTEPTFFKFCEDDSVWQVLLKGGLPVDTNAHQPVGSLTNDGQILRLNCIVFDIRIIRLLFCGQPRVTSIRRLSVWILPSPVISSLVSYPSAAPVLLKSIYVAISLIKQNDKI